MVIVPGDSSPSPALPVVRQLIVAGVRFRLEGDQVLVSPPGVVTPDQREILRTHQDEIRALIPILTDGDFTDRVVAFQCQFEAAPAPTVPAFLFRSSIPYAKGICFSCGDPLPTLAFGRCERCSRAWRLVCGLPMSEDLVTALDVAKVIT